MKLSIIIPVYNVEAYVGRTLESVFATDATDFEVIIVNDGTKDGSMGVIRQFANRLNLTIIEQENQGVSAARNRGLDAAKGDYVWFVDSDDFLVEDGVGKVLRLLAARPGADVLRFPLRYVCQDGTREDHSDYLIEKEEIADGKRIVRDLKLGLVECQRYVLRRSLFSDSRLYFPKGLLFEDLYFGAVLVTIAREIHILPDAVYNYRVREGSIMNTLKVVSCYDMVDIHKKVMQFKRRAVPREDWPWFERYFLMHLMCAYTRMKPFSDSPEFLSFARSQGFYVWSQWLSVHREATWKTKMKFLEGFLCPEKLWALV